MELWIVLNTTAATNIFAGVYDSLELACKAVAATYKAKNPTQSVVFTPAIALPGDAPSKSPTNAAGGVTYVCQYGDTGNIIRQQSAKGVETLFGF